LVIGDKSKNFLLFTFKFLSLPQMTQREELLRKVERLNDRETKAVNSVLTMILDQRMTIRSQAQLILHFNKEGYLCKLEVTQHENLH
jgi:hypothetical protein